MEKNVISLKTLGYTCRYSEEIFMKPVMSRHLIRASLRPLKSSAGPGTPRRFFAAFHAAPGANDDSGHSRGSGGGGRGGNGHMIIIPRPESGPFPEDAQVIAGWRALVEAGYKHNMAMHHATAGMLLGKEAHNIGNRILEIAIGFGGIMAKVIGDIKHAELMNMILSQETPVPIQYLGVDRDIEALTQAKHEASLLMARLTSLAAIEGVALATVDHGNSISLMRSTGGTTTMHEILSCRFVEGDVRELHEIPEVAEFQPDTTLAVYIYHWINGPRAAKLAFTKSIVSVMPEGSNLIVLDESPLFARAGTVGQAVRDAVCVIDDKTKKDVLIEAGLETHRGRLKVGLSIDKTPGHKMTGMVGTKTAA